MATDRRVVWITGLIGMDVGSADTAEVNVDHRTAREWFRFGKLHEFKLVFPGDQCRMHVCDDRTMIIVSAEIDYADRAARDHAVELTRDIQQATRDEEPGCLAYCFGADPCVDTRIQVYELWADAESLAKHFEHPNYFTMRETLGAAGLTAAVSRKYEVSRDAPVYGADHTPSADFDNT